MKFQAPGWLEWIRIRLQPAVNRVLLDWREERERPEADFVADADW